MKITVVVKEPFKPFEIRQMEKHWRTFREFVGGCARYDSLSPDVAMITHDSYLFNGSPANLKYRDRNHIICGNVIFAHVNLNGDLVDLSQEDAEHLKRALEILFHSFTEEESKKIDPESYATVTIIPLRK